MKYLTLITLSCIALVPLSADAMEFTIRIGRSAVAYAQGVPVYVKDAPRMRATNCDGSRMRATNCDASYNAVRLRASDCSGSSLVEFPSLGQVRDVRERQGRTDVYYEGGRRVQVRERWSVSRGRYVEVDFD